MPNAIDQAYERFLAIRSQIVTSLQTGLNESDIRHSVIDRFLFEVLNWPHDAVFTEPHTPSGYIDYLLTTGEKRSVMVLEAKRGDDLAPATKGTETMTVALSGPVLKPLRDGIRQALAYATENGVPIAAVSDGNTWLFFRASRTDGTKPLDGKGILFPSLKSVTEHFAKFFEMLSLQSIVDRHHLAHLNEAEGLIFADPEQQFYVLPPTDARMRQRDPLASDAALLFAQFFSRLSNEQDREMLRECFVATDESRKADFELEKIIQRVTNTITTLETGAGNALRVELERVVSARHSETVLLIGNKGAGKSTFIDRFFEQALPRALREKCVVVRIDLEGYHGDKELIVQWALAQLCPALEQAICSSDPPSYDELIGIFFSEYQRWSVGSRRHLYEENKPAFKDEFGKHIEERREQRPDEYVRLLLDWAVRGHQKLPCIIFDNTDQFAPTVQDKVYQLAHSLESAASVFNVVPITDRTVWRLSKAGALQSYAARSFYLPVPDAKEIISRRVNFLKSKVQGEPNAAKSYFSRRGFQVEVNDLAILADAVGKVFVQNDHVSGFIGRLGNFDIRRMLKIAERIFLSPDLKIDAIIKSKFGGEDVAADRFRTERALIKGEYDRFSETENEYISNLFQTDAKRPGPPLLAYFILWLLYQRMTGIRADDDDVEKRHWGSSDLCRLFEGCGVTEDYVMSALNRLYERRLIETFDPNADRVTGEDRVAIKESGTAHIELILNSPVYSEQMAITTGINEQFSRDAIKECLYKRRYPELRKTFLQQVMKINDGRMSFPPNQLYGQIREARRRFATKIV